MAEEYLARIEAIVGAPIEDDEIRVDLRWDSVEQARQHVKRVTQMQKELRLVRENVRFTMKEIRASFKEKKAEVKAGFLASIWSRKAAAHSRAAQREELRRQERASLAPYESIILLIDKVLLKLDGLKLELQNWIAANK